ncbi:putative neutral ceramidase superfamily lipid hydrolase [Dysgonomonas hofstadii]|uniref:Putative neutral ceramidase superfamily lipid hydrolase n=1 Tax=Dysgonomonas hofstadii TaxID=637886 RepID=A0A840CQA8_9BACT|nr:hypothetical protein [Dysgonomonas hofstadii]MBB4035794.1 putative neutral ceramidase superfamily lipid hydrolase [Dysgonomonas hofstadii]
MEKTNRYVSFELLLALLFIIAFFLPWLDMGLVKVVGWDIPDIQKKMTKVTNFFKFFSKNKESVYTTYIIYLIPLFSFIVMSLWLLAKPRIARILLMVTGFFALIVSFNLFYKLPKIGSGVYLLCGASVVTIVYLIIIFRRNKKRKAQLIDTPPEVVEEDLEEQL